MRRAPDSYFDVAGKRRLGLLQHVSQKKKVVSSLQFRTVDRQICNNEAMPLQERLRNAVRFFFKGFTCSARSPIKVPQDTASRNASRS